MSAGKRQRGSGETPLPPGWGAARVRRLRRRLLGWYRRSRRDLPWRETRDPYAIHLSEIMLQQTTVAAVLPYYRRFLERFPTASRLARADEEEVLALWSGLGYYHRARRLHAAVREVESRWGGRFPETVEDLRSLPGVGEYTAAAVASIAFGLPEAVVDGNVIRVLSRTFALRGDSDSARLRRRCREIAGALLAPRLPGDFNQALMELGATACTPRSPRCSSCPLRVDCEGRRRGDPERFPGSPGRRAAVTVLRSAALVRERGRLLLARIPEGRPNGGLLELPAIETGETGRGGKALERGLARELGLRVRAGRLLGTVRHAITHRRISLEVYEARREGGLPAGRGLRFVPLAEADETPLTGATRRALRLRAGGRNEKGRPEGRP